MRKFSLKNNRFFKVIRAARSLGTYFEFLQVYCVENNLLGLTLEDIKNTIEKEMHAKVNEVFRHFMSFLKYHYKLRYVTRKEAVNLEPDAVMAYMVSFFVAVGLESYFSAQNLFSAQNIRHCEL